MINNRRRLARVLARFESLEDRRLLTADFTVVSLGDTQYLSEVDPLGELPAITQWVADNAASKNIAFLSQVGDFLRRGYSNTQAAYGAAAMAKLNGIMPYCIDIGNHDFDNSIDDLDHHISSANFTSYFGDSFYQNMPNSGFGGSSLDQRNHFQIITPAGGTQQYMIMSLEWAPEASAITWAQGVINAHRQLPIILTTHEYLNTSGRTTSTLDSLGNAGQALFTKLIQPNPQIFLVLSGHSGAIIHQTTNDSAGLPVFETSAEFAASGVTNGSDSYIQLFNFSPDNGTISVTTYSPVLNTYLTGANYAFTLSIDFAARFAFATGAVANDDAFDKLPGQPISGNIVANDSSSTGASLTASAVTQPAHGWLTLSSTGAFTYVPVAGYHGNDTFTYKVSDGTNTSNLATVTLRVNTAPVATGESINNTEGRSVIINVLRNDVDPDGDAMMPMLTSQPVHGAVFANADGTLTYFPDPKYTGVDSFTYVANDGKALSAGVQVSVTTSLVSDAVIYNYPIAETTTTGGVKTGDFNNLGFSDGIIETIAETTASNPTLEQRWTFNVTGGSEVTFCVNGWHPTGSDEYHFKYSTNGTSWSDLTQIVPSSSKDITRYKLDVDQPYQMWSLPAATKGTVYIRATDAQSTATNSGSLSIDEMFIRCNVDAMAPAVPDGLAVVAATAKTALLSWPATTDNVGVKSYDVYTVQGTTQTLAGNTTATTILVTGLSSSTPYSFFIKARDAAGNISVAGNSASATTTPVAIKARSIFYNNSGYDGANPLANTDDDAAIDAGKTALLPGAKASFFNYTASSKGINGIMVDIDGLAKPASLSASDFDFKVGNGSWASTTTPSVNVRLGAGVGGSDRVTFIWSDGAIKNQWLQATVKATVNTGLAAADVFCFGNAVGETGNNATNAIVDGTDFVGVRDHTHSALNPAFVTYAYDINKDGLVDGTDLDIVRANATNFITALKLTVTTQALNMITPKGLFSTSAVSASDTSSIGLIEPANVLRSQNQNVLA